MYLNAENKQEVVREHVDWGMFRGNVTEDEIMRWSFWRDASLSAGRSSPVVVQFPLLFS